MDFAATAALDVAQLLQLVLSRPNPSISVSHIEASAPFVISDLAQHDSPIIYCSPAFETLTGYAASEVVVTDCRFLQHPSGFLAAGATRHFVDSDAVHRCKSAIAQGTETQECMLNYRRGGHPFLNLITILPIPRYTARSPTYSIGLSLDLVQNPDAVKKSGSGGGNYAIDYSRVIPAAAASAPTASPIPLALDFNDPGYELLQYCSSLVLVLSPNLYIIYASPSSQQLLDFAPKELLKHPLASFCHPSDVVGLVRTIRQAGPGQTIEHLLRMRRKNDGYVWVDFGGSLSTAQGPDEDNFISLIGREYHIASRVDLSEHSKDSEGLMFGTSARVSASGIVLRVSSSSRTVLGRSPRELYGAQIQAVVHPESLHRFERDLALAVAGKTVTGVYFIRGQQDRRLASHFIVRPGGHGKGAQGANVNVLELQVVLARGFGVGRVGTELASLTTVTDCDDNREARPFDELLATRSTSWVDEVQRLQQENKELASRLEFMLRDQKRRRRRKTHEASVSVQACSFCQTTQSPEWRRGPTGPQQLCNACGLKWIKRKKDEDAAPGPGGHDSSMKGAASSK